MEMSKNKNAPAAAKHIKGISITPEPDSTTTVKSHSSLDWADDFILSDEDADKIAAFMTGVRNGESL